MRRAAGRRRRRAEICAGSAGTKNRNLRPPPARKNAGQLSRQIAQTTRDLSRQPAGPRTPLARGGEDRSPSHDRRRG